ncbi:GNAT family N-acetyltransferase [Halalkalibaculum sp. DA384]|uniref:GNAT family N-acetyltransferase n=1 Tax=Halalkalibaculum sp. DA384 TaxID=3373606 RepID=UPI0037549E4B
MIKKLDWDSNFFGYNIGRLDLYRSVFQPSDIYNLDSFDLIYLYAHEEVENKEELPKPFTKIIFSKKLEEFYSSPSLKHENIYNINNKNINNKEKQKLINLSYQSGIYSRFKLDEKFSDNEFEKLYQKWIENSLSKKIADRVFVCKKENEIVGFVTLRLRNKKSVIGLIAVDEKYRGVGIGSKLLDTAKIFAEKEKCKYLEVATQLQNKPACNFYLNNGFFKKEVIHIYHLWNQ